MRHQDATKAIFARWIAMWPGLQPAVTYTFDNVVKAEPDDALFARVGITEFDSQLYTLGPHGSNQRRAYIDVRLSGPANAGRLGVDDLIDSVRSIYERVRFAMDPTKLEYGIVTHASVAKPLRRDRDAAQLWIMQVLTPCEWYESH